MFYYSLLPHSSTSNILTITPGLSSLRSICLDPNIHTLTLPLISRFYGPSDHPSLFAFPGCTSPNARQIIQAPGLLNCSALGVEVQACQALGKRVLLSIKADGVCCVGGNIAFGNPNAKKEPFGPAFSTSNEEKRDDKPKPKPLDILNLPKPVRLNATSTQGNPVLVAEVNPLGANTEIHSPSTTILFPNLFDESHPASSFALTLFSLFGEGHTERADLRPLGPDVPSGSSPPVLNVTNWVNPILTALQRPLGEEVVVHGFDVQIPAEWKGMYQDKRFGVLVTRLTSLHDKAWFESGGAVGGPADLGADGKGVVYQRYIGDELKVRSAELTVVADIKEGWVEWNPLQG